VLDSLHIYASGAATQTYSYDANGNRVSYLNDATPPVSLSYNVDPASNRLLGISGSSKESFTYDATGNMLSYSAPFADYSFSYDARNRQTEAFVGAIGTSWLINGLGQRVSQVAAGVPQFNFVYDEAGHLIGKYDGSGNPLWETAWLGDLPVAVLEPAGQFYIAPDHLGAPHQITDAGAAAVWLWPHDPFGSGAPMGAFTYELRFPGQFFDQSTKLHYNYFRDYDPRLARYIESDPIGLWGGINAYTYVKGNPVSHIDAFGLNELWKFLLERIADKGSDILIGKYQEDAAARILGPELGKNPALVQGLVGLIGGAGTGFIAGATAGTILGLPVVEAGGTIPAGFEIAGAIAGGTVEGAWGLTMGALEPLFHKEHLECADTASNQQTSPSPATAPWTPGPVPNNGENGDPDLNVQRGLNSGFGDAYIESVRTTLRIMQCPRLGHRELCEVITSQFFPPLWTQSDSACCRA
jgi:RHS repeat-associated protein